MPNGCAVYRRWGAAGELEAEVNATGGAVTVTRSTSASSIELDIVFPGGKVFSTAFTLNDSIDCIQ